MELKIKGMVCNRCIYILSAEFKKLNIEVCHIALGEVTVKNRGKEEFPTQQIEEMLRFYGFEWLHNKEEQLVKQIQRSVEQALDKYNPSEKTIKWSVLLSEACNKDYEVLSALFSSVEGHTLEQFIMGKKIDKARAYLLTTSCSLTEIAYQLGYSSASYLSYQIKKQTGFSASYYQNIRRQQEKKEGEEGKL